MIYATSAAEIEVRRRAFIRKWRLKCKAVADSLEEAGDRLFTFTRLPVSQWKSGKTTCQQLNGSKIKPCPFRKPGRFQCAFFLDDRDNLQR
jgi:transposase-like protein